MGDDGTYEELRLRNIQRNNAILSALEINSRSCFSVPHASIKSEDKQSKKAKQRLSLACPLLNYAILNPHLLLLQSCRDHFGNSRVIAHCKFQG
jgi:hypothetical protein